MRRLLAAALVGIVAAFLAAAPAAAHGTDAPDATDYRTVVTGITPVVAGLRARTIEAGARMELVNGSGRTIEVLGYDGEPYLELRADGVYENTHSPAAYLNATLDGDTPVPAQASPARPPSWRKISDGTAARWHDHRTRWTSEAPPAPAAADPSRPHRLSDWSVPLRDGVTPMEVRGTLDWLPPPLPGAWWAGAVLLAVAVAAVAAAAGAAGRRHLAAGLLAALALVAALTALGYAGGRQLDAGATGVGGILAGILLYETWAAVSALGAVAAGVLTLAGRPVGDFALALAGVGVALFAGVDNAAVFAGAVAPVPGPAWWARLAVTVVLGVGAGLAVAGMLRLRAAKGRPAHPAAE